MRIAYFDCFSGVSGDMILGALIDAGADASIIEQQINSLPIEPVHICATSRRVRGIQCTDVSVRFDTSGSIRNLAAVENILIESTLSPRVRDGVLTAFRLLATAEARVHGLPVGEVHFHEVGALDAIADIVGCFIALELLQVERVVSSPLPWGRGMLNMAHGTYPLPAPAVAELLCGVPCYGVEEYVELVTPTGASLLRTLVSHFGPLPAITPERIGYGAGKRELPKMPNLLRVIIGSDDQSAGEQEEQVEVVETQVDDMSPEHFSLLAEKLASSEALDYYFTPVYMKKGRPGVLITLLGPPGSSRRLTEFLFMHTSTLGVRHSVTDRTTLRREIITVETRWGPARVKVGYARGRLPKIAPEYEDCRALALANDIPLDVVFREVLAQAGNIEPQVDTDEQRHS